MIPNVKVGVENVSALSLTVRLNRLNAFSDRDGKIYAPRFPKSQTEGWFVILCKEATDEIIAIKRVGWSSGNKAARNKLESARTVIKFPEEESGGFKDGRKLDVWVASDGYMGMVYQVQSVEVPDVPKVTDDGKKEKGTGQVQVAGVGGPSLS
jgi:antiviral helicase SLH1